MGIWDMGYGETLAEWCSTHAPCLIAHALFVQDAPAFQSWNEGRYFILCDGQWKRERASQACRGSAVVDEVAFYLRTIKGQTRFSHRGLARTPPPILE